VTIAAAVLALAAFAAEGPAAPGAAAGPSTAIQVHAGPLEKVLADAKAGGKVVLLDFYTDT
jgi:hypothetical protein